MTPTYNVPEAVRRSRLAALKAAKWLVGKGYGSRTEQLIAAEELLSYKCFTPAQIAGWLGLPEYLLHGNDKVEMWGIRSLQPEQFDVAIELAQAGVDGSRPKALIRQAHKVEGMSFDMIGALVCIHKNEIRRVVRRLDGEAWT